MKFPSFVNDLTIPPAKYHQLLREWTGTMRETSPIARNEENDTWVVFLYDDVVRVQSDYATFSSRNTVKSRAEGTRSTSIIEMDPPLHRQMRSLITQAFSARTISEMAPRIQAITNELFDRVIAQGKMDWMTDLANPLPVIVIAEMLGLPREKWQQFKAWTDAIINKTPDVIQAQQQFSAHFVEAIQERSQHPRQDVLSLLMAAEVDGERLSFEDLIGFCFTLFIAGNITTTNVLGNAILCFDEHPEALERLYANPGLVPSAVEEVLRYMGPFRSGPNDLVVGRIATTDVTLCGQLVRKGEKIEVSRISANFDERQFPNAEQFDIARNPNRHQSFGHGIHFCIGAPLARLEIKIALETMLKRFQQLHLIHDEPLKQVESRLIFGPQSLPMAFRPV